jgi:hypothetical protein
MDLFILMTYYKYNVNRTSTFNVMATLSSILKSFERGITKKIVKQELTFFLSHMALFIQMIFSKN